MNKCHLIAIATAIIAGPLVALGVAPFTEAIAAQDPPVSFQEDILPVFQVRCASCHSRDGEGYKASGLDLTSYQAVLTGTKFGPMVIPGDPDSSNLMRLLDWRASPELRMPHNKKQLSVCDRNSIRTWIRQGAKDN
jgi:mono/diheme cytochrome c family protein